MNNNDNYEMYQEGNLYSINEPVPITNLNIYPSPFTNANLTPNVYGIFQNSNKNVAQIGYNPTLPTQIKYKLDIIQLIQYLHLI